MPAAHAFNHGKIDYSKGIIRKHNPYEGRSKFGEAWDKGWVVAQMASKLRLPKELEKKFDKLDFSD